MLMENPIIKKRHLNKFYLQAETSLCDTVYEEADYMSVIKKADPKIPEPNHIRVFFLNELRPTSSVCSHKHTSDEFKLFDISISISISEISVPLDILSNSLNFIEKMILLPLSPVFSTLYRPHNHDIPFPSSQLDILS